MQVYRWKWALSVVNLKTELTFFSSGSERFSLHNTESEVKHNFLRYAHVLEREVQPPQHSELVDNACVGCVRRGRAAASAAQLSAKLQNSAIWTGDGEQVPLLCSPPQVIPSLLNYGSTAVAK